MILNFETSILDDILTNVAEMNEELLNKLLKDLKMNNFRLVSTSKRLANRCNVSLKILSETVSQLIKASVLVANTANESNWDGETLHYFKGVYFVVSGGGISNEIIESCSNKRRDELIKIESELLDKSIKH